MAAINLSSLALSRLAANGLQSRAAKTDRTIFIGVDLGKQQCHSAIVVVERIEEGPSRDHIEVLRGTGSSRKRYVIRHVERVRLGTQHSDVVRRVKHVVSHLSVTMQATCVVVVDESGVGVPVVEAMREAGLGSFCRLNPVVITAGQSATASSVPRAELITKMKMMAERGELELATGCMHGEWLKRELLHLRLEGGGLLLSATIWP